MEHVVGLASSSSECRVGGRRESSRQLCVCERERKRERKRERERYRER